MRARPWEAEKLMRAAARVRVRPWEAENLMHATALSVCTATRVGVSEVLSPVSRLAAALVGRAATLSASLCF